VRSTKNSLEIRVVQFSLAFLLSFKSPRYLYPFPSYDLGKLDPLSKLHRYGNPYIRRQNFLSRFGSRMVWGCLKRVLSGLVGEVWVKVCSGGVDLVKKRFRAQAKVAPSVSSFLYAVLAEREWSYSIAKRITQKL
jgi:hypothetical protein